MAFWCVLVCGGIGQVQISGAAAGMAGVEEDDHAVLQLRESKNFDLGPSSIFLISLYSF